MKVLPAHFSMISAQKGAEHDAKAHNELKSDLKKHGLKHTETTGHYGYPEKGYMVEHSGKDSDKAKVEHLGRKHKQESVLHSSVNKNGTRENTLKYSDNRPDIKGSGHTVDSKASDLYTEHPTIGKFQVGLNFPE